MTLSVRNLDTLKADAAITVHNKDRLDALKLKAGLIFHADATAFTAAAAPTDLTTSVAVANAVRAVYITHIAGACDATTGQGEHIAADATNTITAAVATDQTTLNTLLNDIKSKYGSHRALAASHATADGTNTITAANATDATTSVALAVDLNTKIPAHMAAAFNTPAVLLVAP